MNVLLVEDSADDVATIQRLVAESPPPVSLTVLRDGDEASEYLSRRSRERGSERPHVILLDIRLPGVHGIELLRRIKADSELREVPVVMLTGSDRDEDVREAQKLGAHSYVVKPMTARYFRWIARSVASCRMRLARIGEDSP